MLIELGADVDAEDITGRKPIYLALYYKCPEILWTLLYNKANP